MAGPGGGPPRKSHTKSRKGCKTCKRRHIRCDETFPQCRNCTKHNCRCDYMDSPTATDEPPRSPRAPDLLMTPEIERDIDAWRMTGNPPLPELRNSPRSHWYRYSSIDLRLIHHISDLSIDMHRRGYSNCTVWAQKMPMFLSIALSNDFVMSAILALSAAHLAWMTENSETENLAYHHRGVALKGLHEAIGAFRKENSEAILAASMLLSWQATEWRSWASLQQGVSTVLNAMQPWWKKESELANYLEGQRTLRSARTPVTPNFPGAMSEIRSEDIVRIDQAYAALETIQQRVSHIEEHFTRVTELLSFLQQLREDLPLQAPEEAFERLQRLRAWLFWLPPTMLRSGESDLGALAILSQFFGIALALEPLFPEIGGAYLGTMAVPPIEEIQRMLLTRKASQPYDTGVEMALNLIQQPCEIVLEYKNRLQWSASNVDSYHSAPHSPYALPNLQLASPPDPAGFSTYGTSPIRSPANLAVPGSPYHLPGSSGLGSRRQSHHQYLEPSPMLSPELTDERTLANFGTLGDSPAYSPAYVTGSETSGMGYHESIFSYNGGLVASELWT